MKKVVNYLVIFCMVFTCVFIASTSSVSAVTQITYYISPTGSDANPGTISQPFATVQHARDVIRTVNSNMTGDIIVYLRGGTYTLSSTLQLGSQDSGTNGFNIIYQNYPSETPVISGGMSVTGWSLYDQSKNVYRAFVGTGFYSRHLYVNGVRATRARSETNPAGFTLDAANGFNLPTSGPFANMGTWGNASDIEIHQNVQWSTQWGAIDHIASGKIYMKQPFWQTQVYMSQYNISMTYPQVIENAYELLDSDGEWYLDRFTGYLYYKPLSGQNIDSCSVILPKLEMLIEGNHNGTLGNVLQNVQFEGLTFAYTTYLEPGMNNGRADHQGGVQAIKLSDSCDCNDFVSPSALDFVLSKNILIQRCTIQHIGESGIGFGYGCQNNVVDSNAISDISINGVNVGDVHYSAEKNGLNQLGMSDRNPSDPRCIVSGNFVTNNTISKIGNEIYDAVGIFGGFVKFLNVDHNTLYDLPYSGISVGWGWGYADNMASFDAAAVGCNSITYNRIYDYMKVLYDGGAIYTLGQQNSSTIRYNYVSGQNNLYAYIYLDSGTSYYSIKDNVVNSQNGTCEYWFIAQDNMGAPPSYSWSYDNDVENNYYSSNLKIFKTPTTNACTNNISVSNGNWGTHANDIMACAGAGNGIVSTYNTRNGPNLALNKTVSASNYYQNNATYSGAKAIDGFNFSRWATDACNSAWLEVDFGTNTTFNMTTLKECIDYGQRIKAYQIQYWDGSSWVNAYSGGIPKPYQTDVFSPVTSSKVRLDISQTDGNGPSVWEFEVYNTSLGYSNFKIVNRASTTVYNNNLVITPYAHSTSAANLIQWNCENTSDQYWTLVPSTNDYYKIENVACGLVVTPYAHTSGYAQLIQWDFDSNYDQYWSLVPTGDGYFKIKNRVSGLVVTPYQHSTSSGLLYQDTDQGGYDQFWGLDDVQ